MLRNSRWLYYLENKYGHVIEMYKTIALKQRYYNHLLFHSFIYISFTQNPELLDEWEDGTGLKLYEGYGQTETVS